jgi:hypothetical protein
MNSFLKPSDRYLPDLNKDVLARIFNEGYSKVFDSPDILILFGQNYYKNDHILELKKEITQS